MREGGYTHTHTMLDRRLRILKEWLISPIVFLFIPFSPNTITLFAASLGLMSFYASKQGDYKASLIYWWLNRLFDGIDGTVARQLRLNTDFGGYLDIIMDFTVYSLLPIGLAISIDKRDVWLSLSIMEGIFFINSAGLFCLSAILEKRNIMRKESTTVVTMPSGLIEGTETVIFFSLFIIFPNNLSYLYNIFSSLIFLTILQRLVWAYYNLDIINQK